MAKGCAPLYDDRPSHRSHALVPAPWIETTAGDETSPERLRFSQIANGQALCANLSGSDYYRFFVP